MDDIRIYNYALTPQKILALYESYPEEKGPHAKITLHTNQLTGILVNQKININIDTNIYANSKDFVLNIFIPNILVVNDYTFAPTNGISPLSGQIIKETTSTGINYKIPIKDRLIGTMSSSFILYFKTLETYHEQETTITANIEKRGKEVTQDNLTLKAWNNANLTFRIMTKPTTL